MDDALARFRRWVSEQETGGKSRTQVAADIGCSESGLSRVLGGTRGVGGLMAAKIEHATLGWSQGAIRAADWYELERPKPTPELDATGS